MQDSQKQSKKPRLKPWKTKFLSFFSKIKANGTISLSTKQSTEASHCYELYRSIHELPFSTFTKVQIRKEYSLIVKSGHAPHKEIMDTWSRLVMQYHDAIGEIGTTMRLIIFKDIGILACNLELVYKAVEGLKRRYIKFFHDELNKLCECSFALDPIELGSKAYFETLKRYIKRSKGIAMQLRLKHEEYDQLESKSENLPKPDENYYAKMLISLSDHSKIHIPDDIMTFEYCERVRRLTEYVKNKKTK